MTWLSPSLSPLGRDWRIYYYWTKEAARLFNNQPRDQSTVKPYRLIIGLFSVARRNHFSVLEKCRISTKEVSCFSTLFCAVERGNMHSYCGEKGRVENVYTCSVKWYIFQYCYFPHRYRIVPAFTPESGTCFLLQDILELFTTWPYLWM